jgi:V8-like Glu-specific endopeptidase
MRYLSQPFIVLIFLLPVSPVAAEENDLSTQMMRATVMITHDTSTATGFVLTANDSGQFMLVTAAHVFEKTRGDQTMVVFRIKEAEGVYKKESVKLVIRKAGKPEWTKHATEDVAAIWIVPPKTADLAKLSPDLLASDESLKKHGVHPGELLSYLGFPHRNEANEAGFPILRSGPIATFPLVPTAKTKTFLLSANIFEGDSGGPVYLTRASRTGPDKEELRLILGLVTGQRFLDEEAKGIYGTSKVRHRLGLAIIVHASFIRETIDRLP